MKKFRPQPREFQPRALLRRVLRSGCLWPSLALLAVGLALVLVQWTLLNSGGFSFTVGEPAPMTYRVIAPMSYDDLAAARALRQMVSDSVVNVTVRDLSAKARLQRRLAVLLEISNPAQSAKALSLPEGLLNALSDLGEVERARLLNLTAEVGNAYIDQLDADKDRMDSLSEGMALLWQEIGKRIPDASEANLVYQILSTLGNPNFRSDPQLTEDVRQAAMDEIPAVERHFEIGDVIVARGGVVTPQAARLLRLQGYWEDVFPITQIYIVLLMVLLLPLWLTIVEQDLIERPSWWCVAFIVTVAWVCEVLATQFYAPGVALLPCVMAACLCIPNSLAFSVAFAGMISGVFIITNIAISDFLMLLEMSFIAAITGFYLLRHVDSRAQVTRRVIVLALVLALSRMALLWLQGVPVTRQFSSLDPGWAFAAEYGLFIFMELASAQILLMLLPLVEEPIGVLSILRLRELSHPSSPLLRAMQREAPGTYQHCLTIATLIEPVALELGLDANLVKAGAYYHDVGKLRRPQFFVENQMGERNAHDAMSPTLSALTIISHVNEGLQLAWEAKLPRRIRDFIAEHHGTTCVRYFYNKARAGGEKVEWSDFCYPGPKPRSRETALLMIVDSLEAAVRNLGRRLIEAEDDPGAPHPNRGRSQAISALQETIDQVVASKANEGQFDDVRFTQRDLTRIKEVLFSVILSIYHTRHVKKIETVSSREEDRDKA